ncbi:hypothetical protein LPJ56_004508, partial [Coemansia sp. RSA 2599]
QRSKAEDYYVGPGRSEFLDSTCFNKCLTFGSSAAPKPPVSANNDHDCDLSDKRRNFFDAENSMSQNLPQLDLAKALLSQENDQPNDTLNRRHDISVQSLSGLCNAFGSRNNSNTDESNGYSEQ